MSKIDLHCHSTASDGTLKPRELVERAVELGLTHLALTDHDCVAGFAEAREAAASRLQVIPGAELSALWEGNQIHVVGLFIGLEHPELKTFLEGQLKLRIQRAEEIGSRLEKLGFADAYARTLSLSGSDTVVTRGNYARFIVAQGKAVTVDEAFNTYLKKGRKAYVRTQWPELGSVVEVILHSGGVPVLAHPLRYDLTNSKLRRLVQDFKSAGGRALEVASCQQRPCDREYLSRLAVQYELKASVGSDFHTPQQWRELGYNLDLPATVVPVWQCPEAAEYQFMTEESLEQ
ncbi:MAG: PHP domain-containing protein [Succinivibrio sp.]|nr:PHP domain-containing protein [Succinivibrio sp.]